jgi:hypothetical protein
MTYVDCCDIKRKIRKLKKLELKIRFNLTNYEDRRFETLVKMNQGKLVWDEFFDFHDVPTKKVKYPMGQLTVLNKEQIKEVLSEYFFHVYYRFYKENGMFNFSIYDPDILAQLGLPYDADSVAIKKRFRELAKLYHPDAGGDSEKFMELVEQFESFHL